MIKHRCLAILSPARRPASIIAHILLALALLLTALPFFAQETMTTLTLDQALSIAMEQNRDIQKAEAYRQWVRGKYVEERSAALPQFTVTASGTRAHDESLRGLYGQYGDLFPVQQDIRTGQIAVSQALYTWGQVGAAIRAAKVGLASAEDQLRLYRQAVRRDVSSGFYDVVLAKRLRAIAVENLAQRERHLEEARKRYDLGTATDYDVLAAEVAVENARPEVIRADNAVKSARQKMAFLLAESDYDLDVSGSLETEIAPPPAYDESLQTALDHRPDLIGLAHREEVYRELVKIARAGDKPRLDFRADYGSRKYLVDQLDSHGKTWNAGIYFSFPIFDGFKSRGRVIQARSDLTTAEIETAKARDRVALEVRTALDAVKESAEIVTALGGTVDQAQRLLQMAEKGFEYGVKTRLEVEDAQLNLSQAEGNLARARRDYLVARVTLQWVEGILGE